MSVAKQSKGSPELDQRVEELYTLARQKPDDTNLQEAVDIVKTLRRSQGALKGWNGRYREENNNLNQEIQQISTELSLLNQQMQQLTEDKQRILREREKFLAELKHIETEVQVAAARVKNTKTTWGKLDILWTLVKSLFLDESFHLGKIDNSLPPEERGTWLGSSAADIQKHERE
jgi:chromosome segregation ATPase